MLRMGLPTTLDVSWEKQEDPGVDPGVLKRRRL